MLTSVVAHCKSPNLFILVKAKCSGEQCGSCASWFENRSYIETFTVYNLFLKIKLNKRYCVYSLNRIQDGVLHCSW